MVSKINLFLIKTLLVIVVLVTMYASIIVLNDDIINNNDAKETVSFALHLARGGGEKRFEWRSKRRTTTKNNFIKQNGSKTTRAFNTFV